MFFPIRDIEVEGGLVVKAWTPCPDAPKWGSFKRMVTAGTLVEVPDRLLADQGKPKSKARGRPRKRFEK